MEHNPALTSFAIPALTEVGNDLRVLVNDVLIFFDLSLLTKVGNRLSIAGNDALAECLVDALVAQIQAGLGIGVEIYTNNNESCTCSEVDGVLVADCP